eukprot:TRINITY_DN33953_c0_g1_i1.p1 TRINITY_DN33953_c0_g1~~TRINITY_DN33953_c0_g1_i1.p1  ORF type:complete len:158 (-),score=28.63 TRINITY_DN33953_c0_g1_i1:46-519(-)
MSDLAAAIAGSAPSQGPALGATNNSLAAAVAASPGTNTVDPMAGSFNSGMGTQHSAHLPAGSMGAQNNSLASAVSGMHATTNPSLATHTSFTPSIPGQPDMGLAAAVADRYVNDPEAGKFTPKDWGWANSSMQDACCLLYTSPSPRDRTRSRMPSSA